MISKGRARLGSLLLVVMAGLFCASCGDDADVDIVALQGENGFVGKVEGTDALISIVTGTQGAVVYVCNGEEQIALWFSGDFADGTDIALQNQAGARVSASLVDGRYQGEVVLADGKQHAFSAAVASGAGAGLYRVIDDKADAAKIKAGWILDGTGAQRGSWSMDGLFSTAPKLENEDVEHEGTTYTVYTYKTPSPGGPIPVPYPIGGTVATEK